MRHLTLIDAEYARNDTIQFSRNFQRALAAAKLALVGTMVNCHPRLKRGFDGGGGTADTKTSAVGGHALHREPEAAQNRFNLPDLFLAGAVLVREFAGCQHLGRRRGGFGQSRRPDGDGDFDGGVRINFSYAPAAAFRWTAATRQFNM
jgi:hypothetical protein